MQSIFLNWSNRRSIIQRYVPFKCFLIGSNQICLTTCAWIWFQAIWNIVTGWVKKNGKYRAQRAKHVVLFHLPGWSLYEDFFNVGLSRPLFVYFRMFSTVQLFENLTAPKNWTQIVRAEIQDAGHTSPHDNRTVEECLKLSIVWLIYLTSWECPNENDVDETSWIKWVLFFVKRWKLIYTEVDLSRSRRLLAKSKVTQLCNKD